MFHPVSWWWVQRLVQYIDPFEIPAPWVYAGRPLILWGSVGEGLRNNPFGLSYFSAFITDYWEVVKRPFLRHCSRMICIAIACSGALFLFRITMVTSFVRHLLHIQYTGASCLKLSLPQIRMQEAVPLFPTTWNGFDPLCRSWHN